MAASPTRKDRPPRGRIMLAIFLVCFCLFTLDVLLGKAVIAFGWEGVPLLSDVAEFLLLLFTVTMFVAATLRLEQARNQENGNTIDNVSKPREATK
ncbi:MAG: hypothetical protein IIC53_00755 [Proteobacteria bacterium]|nr:hypothetical protein [Pseudomonadota bacterium]MCH8999176.1 hypothetical protein [Pseudomonadota bacterium]